MNIKFARIVVILLMLSMSVVASACSNKGGSGKTAEPSQSEPATQPQTSAAPSETVDLFAKYDPPIVVKSVREVGPNFKFKPGESIENNIWSKSYLDQFGIDLKYDWIVSSDYNQKLNVTITSGKLPDIFQVDANQLKDLINAGLIQDLTQVYEKYATPLTKEIMTSDGPYALRSATADGKLMGLPLVLPTVDAAPLLWVRKDWLDKLKLPEPKTMDDVVKISEAFVKGDPDGDAKPDSTGLAIQKDLLGGYAGLDGFFAGYHAYPDFWLKDSSGALVYGSIQPEVKTALAKLQEMYKAGHFDREFAVKDATKASETMVAGKNGMHYGQMWNPLWPLGGNHDKDKTANWQAYPIVSADNQPAKPGIPSTNAPFYYVVRKGFEHPEALMKMFALFYKTGFDRSTDPAAYAKYFIDNGVETGGYSLVQGGPPLVDLEIHQNFVKALKSNDPSILSPREKTMYDNIMKQLNGQGSTTDWGYERVFGEFSAFTVIDKYNTDDLFQRNEFFGAPTNAMVEKNPTLAKMELETFSKIIMGDSIDKFDSFVEQWKKLGGDDITKEVNDWNQKNK